MKMTVVTNARGKVIACVHGSVSAPAKRRGITAKIVPQEGQKFHEVEAPANYARLEPLDLLKAVARQLRR